MYMYIVCTFCILIITNVCTQTCTCTCVFEHYFPQKELFTLINFSNNFVYMRYTVYIHIIILCCCMYTFVFSYIVGLLFVYMVTRLKMRENGLWAVSEVHINFIHVCGLHVFMHVHVNVHISSNFETLVAHNNFQQTLIFKHSLFAILHRKPMKYGVQEDQLMFLLDTKVSLPPV